MIVLTLHLPNYKLIHLYYQNSKYTQYFVPSCVHLISKPVHTWLYGHTHIHIHIHKFDKINKINLICNTLRYRYSFDNNIDFDKTIEIIQ